MKLVRDNIPKIIEDSGRVCKYHLASHDEYKTRLYEKMREELDEFIDTPCYEEAADMWEVFSAICELHGLNLCELNQAVQDKRKNRGAFRDRIVLEEVCELKLL